MLRSRLPGLRTNQCSTARTNCTIKFGWEISPPPFPWGHQSNPYALLHDIFYNCAWHILSLLVWQLRHFTTTFIKEWFAAPVTFKNRAFVTNFTFFWYNVLIARSSTSSSLVSPMHKVVPKDQSVKSNLNSLYQFSYSFTRNHRSVFSVFLV